MATLLPALDTLSSLAGGVWAVIGGGIGPGPYPIGPHLVERSCYCASCRRFRTCERRRQTRTMRSYKTGIAAASVAARIADLDGCRYTEIRLPQQVFDTVSALLASDTESQQDVFRIAVLVGV